LVTKTFFLRSLSELSEIPVLAPRCTTVNEFILGLCPTQEVQDRTALLFELYRIYKEINQLEKTKIKGKKNYEYTEFFRVFLWIGLGFLCLDAVLRWKFFRSIQ